MQPLEHRRAYGHLRVLPFIVAGILLLEVVGSSIPTAVLPRAVVFLPPSGKPYGTVPGDGHPCVWADDPGYTYVRDGLFWQKRGRFSLLGCGITAP
jgi:hypothetical protein